MILRLLASGSTAVLLLVSPAQAQEEQSTPAQQEQTVVATECLENLRALSQRAETEGFWLAGWTGAGVPGVAGPGAAPAPGVRTEPGATTGYGVAARSAAEPPVIGPRHEMAALFRAAEVLAYRGSEEACNTVTAELEGIFDQHIEEMRARGLDPSEIRDWRQAQLLGAEPVDKLPRAFHSDAIIGSDLRNLRDEDLGNIDDVLLDPETGEIGYVLVSRGGFLGIGEEHYAVPWSKLRVAPMAGTFVLDASVSAVQQAPSVGREQLASREGFREERARVDQYWQEQIGG